MTVWVIIHFDEENSMTGADVTVYALEEDAMRFLHRLNSDVRWEYDIFSAEVVGTNDAKKTP